MWSVEVKLTPFFLFVVLTAPAQSTTEHLPVTDDKIADALKAAPNFITDGATIVDYPANKGSGYRVLRRGTNGRTCLPGLPPGSKHDAPGCFDSVFFQWVKDGLAGRSQHLDRLGVSYMYMGRWVPGASGGEFHGTPHYGANSSSRRSPGFHAWRVERHIQHPFARPRSGRYMVLGYSNSSS
jgi:hypothetical protein